MLNIAIVEDDTSYINIIQNFLMKYASESGQRIQTRIFHDGTDIIQNYKPTFDIILMDIEMEFMDGMTAAYEIRKIDNETVIIFITNSPQYAMQGYNVNALDYILKPLTYFAFSQCIEQSLLKRRRSTPRHFITIDIQGGIRKIDESKIQYIEVQSHYSIFHTVEGAFKTKMSLKNAESMLKSTTFFKCHKWVIINLEFVDSIENNNISIGGSIIQVSRAQKTNFLEALNNYAGDIQ